MNKKIVELETGALIGLALAASGCNSIDSKTVASFENKLVPKATETATVRIPIIKEALDNLCNQGAVIANAQIILARGGYIPIDQERVLSFSTDGNSYSISGESKEFITENGDLGYAMEEPDGTTIFMVADPKPITNMQEKFVFSQACLKRLHLKKA